MHKYKDALVDEQGNRIISAAFILVPNIPSNQDDMNRYAPLDYKLKHGLGVCVLTPDEDDGLDELGDLLSKSLSKQTAKLIGNAPM